MTFQKFISDPAARQRYWARSHLGWRDAGAGRTPGTGRGSRRSSRTVITQNVDGLHPAAGTRPTHGTARPARRRVCLDCGRTTEPAALSSELAAAQPRLRDVTATSVERARTVTWTLDGPTGFVVLLHACGGVLKPDVVFFGENVPPERVAALLRAVDALTADARCSCWARR